MSDPLNHLLARTIRAESELRLRHKELAEAQEAYNLARTRSGEITGVLATELKRLHRFNFCVSLNGVMWAVQADGTVSDYRPIVLDGVESEVPQ